MIDYLLMLVSLAFLVVVTAFGVPFDMTAGRVTLASNNIHFVTESGTLAHLISASREMTMDCGEARMCVRPSDRERKRAHIPIALEPCTSADAVSAERCQQGNLVLHLDTSRWILSTLRE